MMIAIVKDEGVTHKHVYWFKASRPCHRVCVALDWIAVAVVVGPVRHLQTNRKCWGEERKEGREHHVLVGAQFSGVTDRLDDTPSL